jgi:hypothetical protein
MFFFILNLFLYLLHLFLLFHFLYIFYIFSIIPPGAIDISDPTTSPVRVSFFLQYPPFHEKPEGSEPFPPNLEIEFNSYIAMTPSRNMLNNITRSLM